MIERLSRGKRNLALATLLVLLAWFAWSIRSVLNPVLLGYLCAYILHPFVLRIEQLGFSRRTAVNLTFVGGMLLAIVISLLLAIQMRSLVLELVGTVKERQAEASQQSGESGEVEARPAFADRLERRLEEFRVSAGEWGLDLPPLSVDLPDLQNRVAELLKRNLEQTAELGLDAAGRGVRFLRRFTAGLLGIAGTFLLLPLYAYYFLFVHKDINAFVRRYLPKRDRERISHVAGQMGEVMGSFFRGRLGVCFLKGLILSAGLWIADVPYALLFGMLSGFLSVVPFFGPFLGFLLAFVVTILDHGVVSALVRTGLVFGIGELLEGYVLVPKVLGDSLGLHPLVVFIALLAGGAALGMLGVIVALPVTAAAVILAREFVLPALRDFADEEPRPA